MDALDLRILATMGMDPWGGDPPEPGSLSPSYIAERVDTTPETVRERVRRMEEAGVIRAYQVYPEPGQAGFDATAVSFRVPGEEATREAFRALALVEGVLEVHDLHGDVLLVGVGHRTEAELDRRLSLCTEITGDAEPRTISTRKGRTDLRPLTHLDWRIVRALRGDAKQSLSDVGEAVGVSYRTVKRHVDRMTEEGSIVRAPVVAPSRIEGVLPVELFVLLADDAGDGTVNDLVGLFPDRLVQRYVPPQGERWWVNLFCFADSLAEAEAMRRKAAEVDGVRRTQMILTRASRETDWLDRVIDARIEDTAPAPSEPPSHDPGS